MLFCLGEVITRHVQAGNGVYNQEPLVQHFGLDTVQSVRELIVTWPNNLSDGAPRNRHIFYNLPVSNNGLLELTIKEDEQPVFYRPDLYEFNYRQVRIGSQSVECFINNETTTSTALLYIENNTPGTHITQVPLTVLLDTQSPLFTLRADDQRPFTQSLSLTLMNGESAAVLIQFAPASEGEASTSLRIETNDPDNRSEETLLLTGCGVPDTDGDGLMDYNDDPDLNDPDADNDGLDDDMEGGDKDPRTRTNDSDGNGLSDALETCMPVMNYSINFQPAGLTPPVGWLDDNGTTGVCATSVPGTVYGWCDAMTPDALPHITDMLNDTWVIADDNGGEWCLELFPGKYICRIAVSKSDMFVGEDGDFVLKVNGDAILKGGDWSPEKPQEIKYAYGEVMIANLEGVETGDLKINLAAGCRIHYIQVTVPVIKAVNFQPSPLSPTSCPVPAGFMADYGLGYNDAFGYGWISGNDLATSPSETLSPSLFIRNGEEGRTGNIVADTFMKTDAPNETLYWKVKLPVGSHRVWLGSYDPCSSSYDTEIELFNSRDDIRLTNLDNSLTTQTWTVVYVHDENDGIPGNATGFLGMKIIGGCDPAMINYIIIADNESDTDGDGLSDSYEGYVTGTDPGNPDTDGDGIDDFTEVTTRWPDPANPEQWITLNPLDADCDDDGVADGEDGMGDTDRDGYPDALDPDSDGDNVYDGVELGINNNETLWPEARRSVPDGVSSAGNIAYEGTDTGSDNFKQDMDPTTTTDARRRDTDGDQFPDGSFGIYNGEDLDANGKVDEGETDPNDSEDYPEGGFEDSDQDESDETEDCRRFPQVAEGHQRRGMLDDDFRLLQRNDAEEESDAGRNRELEVSRDGIDDVFAHAEHG